MFVTLVWGTWGRFVTLVLGKGEVGVVIQVLGTGGCGDTGTRGRVGAVIQVLEDGWVR